ncbi:acetamidase/formamidase family protein [Cupriavidus numazuensis]|uniref:HTH-type transcriptional activator RhaR n=1 Tax=Cupriavidus numazuensis TaxID=221992 RepID=A0ABM8TPE1_9BURK|nr:acetamidase/formamidase family protein [Cupriavidus numazuensis]CAG2156543.1 HTH-type transcriptional activator RhaR [Cupriavidus numazuensis]
MQLLRFSTEAYPRDRRGAAWRNELKATGLHCESLCADHTLHGTIQSRTTPAGIGLTCIASVPQTLAIAAGGGRGLMLLMLAEGEATLATPDLRQALRAGHVVCIPAHAAPKLAFATGFRLLVVHIAGALPGARIAAPLPAGVLMLAGDAAELFGRLLQSLAASFDTVVSADARAIQPFESMIFAYLAAALADNQAAPSAGMTPSSAAVFARVCSRIDARLSEPELCLAVIAADEHMSARYLQKLFEKSGSSFSSYLRTSRLERCRADLANPQYDKLSVSDICYRWGFNDPSYFSHAFREQFGISPRGYRDQMTIAPAPHPPQNISRGFPLSSQVGPTHDGQSARPRRPATVVPIAQARSHAAQPERRHHWLQATDKTVHWGYLSHELAPVLEVASGDTVTIETLTQHASDDRERMIDGDPGAESVFHWTAEQKNVNRRGAGPIDASVYGRGAGEGFGVHICTGPVAVRGAMPGDVLEVRILDIRLRPCANPHFAGRAFGSNAATWWGFHYRDMLTEPREREVVTVFEIDCERADGRARAVYSFRWTPQRDPFGVLHPTIDYPGVPVDHATIVKGYDVLRDVEIPVRPHFGVIAVAPAQDGLIDSIPPSSFAGNLDNWRVTRGASVYLRVAVPGALLSIGDPHASQGDSELCGTAIECSLTGDFQLVLHKSTMIERGAPFADLSYPLVETADEWILHGFSSPNHLAELGQMAQSHIYQKSTLDDAMRDAFRKARRFLMTVKGLSEDEAVTLISVAVDFGITQVVNGNWGVHAIIRKSLFTGPP